VTTGALALGTVNGLLIGLLAVGLVLVYKSNRFLNLAHAQLGALSAMLLAKLVVDHGWPWTAAVLVCVPVGVMTGVLVDRVLVARLRRRSRSTVAPMLLTIGVTQVLLALSFVKTLTPDGTRLQTHGYPLPFHATVRVGAVILGGADVLVLVLAPVLVVALAFFLRLSTLGKMIRAAASNPDAARLCGISTVLVSNITWGIAGGLSAISAILQAPSQGTFNAGALGPNLLLVALGAAAFGAFVSIPWALAGGLALGIVEQVSLAETHNGGTARIIVFVTILLVVLARGGAIAKSFVATGSVVDDRPPLRVPERLRATMLVRRQRMILASASIALAVLAPLLPVFRSESHRFELSLIVIYAITSISLTMLLGWAGQVSLGHVAVIGMGAFVAGRLAPHGLSLPALLAVAGAVGAVGMVVIGLPALRVRGLTLVLTTLGLAVVGHEWLFRQSWFGSTKSFGIDVEALPIARGIGRSGSQLGTYYSALVVLCIVAVAAAALRRSSPGRLIVAVRDDERASAAFGITPATVKLTVLAVSGAIAGFAGVLWADAWRSVSVNQFPPDASIAILAAPVIGGLGSIAGAVAGAVVLFAPTYFLSPHLTGLFGSFGRQIGFQLALGGFGLIAVLLSYPTGIAGMVQRAWERTLESIARHRPGAVRDGNDTLVVRDLDVRFGGVVALDGASITVGRGEIVGLIGPNGAGKTTLINAISGVIRPDRGSITVDGKEMLGLPPDYRVGFGVGRSFQDALLFPGLTVIETLQVALSNRSRVGTISSMLGTPWARAADRRTRSEALTIAERLGLLPWADALTGELSTGTRRICDLAAQVAAKPRVLLLDEPTAGVAQREAEAFGPLLRRIRDELDCAILIVEHDMPLLMGLCDRVYAMESGAVIAAGTPAEIRSNAAVIASYLGTDETAIGRSGSSGSGSGSGNRRRTRPLVATARSSS
jgi:ABC-type branched-subunit amino acid transport system ATPase component/ABC-type branched-subunit amino acid transport system permease subunit